jgi:hypothetical protein
MSALYKKFMGMFSLTFGSQTPTTKPMGLIQKADFSKSWLSHGF